MFVPAKDEICFTCPKRSGVQFVCMVAAWLEITDTGLRLEERGCYGSKLHIYSKNIHSKWRIQRAPIPGGGGGRSNLLFILCEHVSSWYRNDLACRNWILCFCKTARQCQASFNDRTQTRGRLVRSCWVKWAYYKFVCVLCGAAFSQGWAVERRESSRYTHARKPPQSCR